MITKDKIVDPLGIFEEIKSIISDMYPNSLIFAYGSRAKGRSSTGKWDFDVSVSEISHKEIMELAPFLTEQFSGRKDENGKDIRIDLSRNVLTLDTIKNFKNGCLL